MAHQREWTVPCLDAVGRARMLAASADSMGGVLGFPPVGSAAILPSHARTLAVVLGATDQAARQ